MADDDDELGGCATAALAPLFLVPALLVCAVLGGVSRVRERDLRDLDGLARATAQVLAAEDGGKGFRDGYALRFTTTGGEQVRAEVPVESSDEDAEQVEVAYDPARPGRVRTVQDWLPLYEHMVFFAVVCVATVPVVVVWAALGPVRRRLRALLPGQPRRRSRSSKKRG